jgi:hypothetical protein
MSNTNRAKYKHDYQIKYRHTPRSKYVRFRHRAYERKHEVAISFEHFTALIAAPCQYCGDLASRITIDRVDSSKGYVPNNVVECCLKCNMMKRNYTVQDFLSHVAKIHRYNN